VVCGIGFELRLAATDFEAGGLSILKTCAKASQGFCVAGLKANGAAQKLAHCAGFAHMSKPFGTPNDIQVAGQA